MGLLEIEEAIKKLPHDELNQLRDWFEVFSVHSAEAIEHFMVEESERRYAAYQRGEVTPVSLAEFRARYES